MKFFDKFINHDVNANDIQAYIDQWHSSDTTDTVFDYLGMTEDQYAIFIRHPEKTEALRKQAVASYYSSKIERLTKPFLRR